MQRQGLTSFLSLHFSRLPKLQMLEISHCLSLASLPEGIGRLTSLQRLKIEDCPILLQRCKRGTGEDWAKIAHIPELDLQYPPR
jgi:hypothetical protein